jgi:hypothetical protein
MQNFTKSCLLMSVTFLIMCPTLGNAAETVSSPTSHNITAPTSVTLSLVSGGGAGAGVILDLQCNLLDDLKLEDDSAMLASQSQPTFGAIMLKENDTPISIVADANILSTNSPFAREQTQNFLQPEHPEYFNRAQSLSQYQAPTLPGSSQNINAGKYFQIVRTTRNNINQVRQIDGLSTEAWTTTVGWHPGGSMLSNSSTYEATFSPTFFDGESQP